MLIYLLWWVCLYLHGCVLPSITFGSNLFFEIFINVKFKKILIIKKHSQYKYYYPISIISYITTLSYVYTTRDNVPASKTIKHTMTHNETIIKHTETLRHICT